MVILYKEIQICLGPGRGRTQWPFNPSRFIRLTPSREIHTPYVHVVGKCKHHGGLGPSRERSTLLELWDSSGMPVPLDSSEPNHFTGDICLDLSLLQCLVTFRTTGKVPIYDGEARASRSSRDGPDHRKCCPLSLDPLSCFFTAAKFRALASSLIGLQVICLLSPRRFHGSRVVFPHEWPRYSLLVVRSVKDAVFADGGLRAKEIPGHTMHHF